MHVQWEGHLRVDPEHAEGVDILQPGWVCLRIHQEQLDVARKNDSWATVLIAKATAEQTR